MKKEKRNFLIVGILVILAMIFTVLVKTVDVKPVGANESNIGFATINKSFSNIIGVNMICYDITYYLGILALGIAGIYACIGLIQMIKRKSILKIDREIILLGCFYVLVAVIYVFFEKVIINYRPILMEGVLEASYPSSHTLLTICICGSSIIINRQLFKNKITKILNILLAVIMVATVVGRLVSGVHWLTDIIGGILISSALLMGYYSLIKFKKEKNI